MKIPASGRDCVKVLFYLEWDALSELGDHLVQATCLEPQVTVLEDSQEFAVASLEEKLTLLLKDASIEVILTKALVLDVDDIDRQRHVDGSSKLLDGARDIVNEARVEDKEDEIGQSMLVLLRAFMHLFLWRV